MCVCVCMWEGGEGSVVTPGLNEPTKENGVVVSPSLSALSRCIPFMS